jgi:hypothetical protein
MKIIIVEILKKNNKFYIIKKESFGSLFLFDKNINKGRLTKI